MYEGIICYIQVQQDGDDGNDGAAGLGSEASGSASSLRRSAPGLGLGRARKTPSAYPPLPEPPSAAAATAAGADSQRGATGPAAVVARILRACTETAYWWVGQYVALWRGVYLFDPFSVCGTGVRMS